MTVVDIRIAATGDDGVWIVPGAFDTGNLYAGNNFGNVVNGFFRVQLPVPNNATIDAAHGERIALVNRSGTTMRTEWSAWAGDNQTAPISEAEASGATLTIARVTEDSIGAWVADAQYNTPSLVSIVSEKTSHVSWESGDGIVLFWQDDGSDANAHRYMKDYRNSSSQAFLLHVEYTGGALDTTPPTVGAITHSPDPVVAS